MGIKRIFSGKQVGFQIYLHKHLCDTEKVSENKPCYFLIGLHILKSIFSSL